MEALVRVRNVRKTFTAAASGSTCCRGSTSTSARGVPGLMGPSGSGKTTLLNLLGGLDRRLGRGRGRRRRSTGCRAASSPRWRARHVGFVFQMYNLLPVLTAERNVELPLLLTGSRGGRAPPARRHRARARRPRRPRAPLPAPALGRPGAARRHRPRHRHRPDLAALRRADRRPRPQVGDEILDLLTGAQPRHGKTIVMVTHDPHAAERATRTLHLDKGVLAEAAA
jgi:putative ABC transport system ATP-binding protein